MNFRKHSNQTELDQFFKEIQPSKIANKVTTQAITKSAFFQSRKQLSYTAFQELNNVVVKDYYKPTNHFKKWQGFRLAAIDGSSLRLPNNPEVNEEFGVQKGKPNQADCTMGMASIFYDVLNKIVIDSSINPRNTSERECAEKHLAFANSDDLVLFDRGYVAFWLYAYFLQRNIKFCMRAKTNQDKQVKSFIESGEKEAIIYLNPNKSSIKTCEEKGIGTKPIKLRLIRVDLKNEVEVLITNLMDEQEFPSHIFKALYHLRWGIEENYKRLKQWLEIENFSGKSVLTIKQDFYAKIVAENLTTLVTNLSQDKVDKDTKNLRRKYQINYAQALSKMKHNLVRFLLMEKRILNDALQKMVNYISLTKEAVRDGRSNPRKLKNIKNNIHFAGYKCSL